MVTLKDTSALGNKQLRSLSCYISAETLCGGLNIVPTVAPNGQLSSRGSRADTVLFSKCSEPKRERVKPFLVCVCECVCVCVCSRNVFFTVAI